MYRILLLMLIVSVCIGCTSPLQDHRPGLCTNTGGIYHDCFKAKNAKCVGVEADYFCECPESMEWSEVEGCVQEEVINENKKEEINEPTMQPNVETEETDDSVSDDPAEIIEEKLTDPSLSEIIPPPIPAEEDIPLEPQIINGKTLDERLASAYDNLHNKGSSHIIESDFPDLELVFTDNGENTGFPSDILPFHYYYSEEADHTFNLCGVGRSVFICKGKLDRVMTQEDIEKGRCIITEEYTMDPRLG